MPKELPGDEPNDVVFSTTYGVRTIELNRPKKLNSLNGSMARKILPRLNEWEKSQLANVIIMKGAGRALCAGGDVAALAKDNQSGPEGQQRSKDYFALEYKLDHFIATYSKPYVAFMDGITMGGGVGLSVHAPFRIATENTVFAMPETTIGFFPDVGASFFLPRMDGQLGTYLALTSEQLKGVNVFLAGIATHYIDSSSLPDLEARLAELNFNDSQRLPERLRIVNDTIEEFATGMPHDVPHQISGNIRLAIDYCFQEAYDIEEILAALKESCEASTTPEDIRKWAEKTEKTISQRSPTSIKVALAQLRRGKAWNIAETFKHEHNIASKFMEHPDFVEGVSARLIHKPAKTPVWDPPTLAEVPDITVDSFFTDPLKLRLLKGGEGSAYPDYPHAWIGLPRETEVEAVVKGSQRLGFEGVVQHFLKGRNGKMGVREKVEEILHRRTAENDGGLSWQ
ncbi:ClpP/crotonase-like domain-containing protein [Delphinella strobiligena]|nr:ClpP/crotonase-like domain-containing protein [Delphinella strobiligena]